MLSFGDNLICTGRDITPIYSSRGSPLYVDRGYADLGTITNVGSWGWQPYNLTDADATAPDVLRLQFLMKATNHSLATPGSQHGVTLGLVINDNRLVVGTYNVEVEAAADVPNITVSACGLFGVLWLQSSCLWAFRCFLVAELVPVCVSVCSAVIDIICVGVSLCFVEVEVISVGVSVFCGCTRVCGCFLLLLKLRSSLWAFQCVLLRLRSYLWAFKCVLLWLRSFLWAFECVLFWL